MNITNRKVTEYLDGLYRPLTPQLEQMRREAEAEGIPVILRDTERFLAVMLTVIKPFQDSGDRHGDRIFFFLFCGDLRGRYGDRNPGIRQ